MTDQRGRFQGYNDEALQAEIEMQESLIGKLDTRIVELDEQVTVRRKARDVRLNRLNLAKLELERRAKK